MAKHLLPRDSMSQLSELFAAELSKTPQLHGPQSPARVRGLRAGHQTLVSAPGTASAEAAREAREPKTIVQLNSLPFAIDVNQYSNPHSSSNPTGSYQSAYRLSSLADAIPQLTVYYGGSLGTVHKVWGRLLNSANATSEYTADLLLDAKTAFKNSRMAGMAGFPEDWYLVTAQPENWYDIAKDDAHLIPIEIKMSSDAEGHDDFISLDAQEGQLGWKVGGSSPISLNPATTIKSIRLKVLRVDFKRPWFDYEIFQQRDWSIKGVGQGHYSSGKLKDNDGVFPLITIGMLIGSKVSIEGDFAKEDLKVLRDQSGQELSLGPFLIKSADAPLKMSRGSAQGTVIDSNIRQIIGYLSNLVPLSPALPASTVADTAGSRPSTGR